MYHHTIAPCGQQSVRVLYRNCLGRFGLFLDLSSVENWTELCHWTASGHHDTYKLSAALSLRIPLRRIRLSNLGTDKYLPPICRILSLPFHVSDASAVQVSTPRLPPELERYIFELSALASRSNIPSYLLVAHRVHIWLPPNTLNDTHRHSRRPPSLRRTSSTSTSQGLSHTTSLRALLGSCKSTHDLALWAPTSPHLLPLLQALPLTRLAVEFTRLFGGPLCVNFTHTRVRGPSRTSTSSQRASTTGAGVFWSARGGAVNVREGEVVEARLFMLICVDHVEEWEIGAQGGHDIWARGEAFIAKKEAGEVKGEFYFD
ncbi:hypothetical protein DFH09DRAFT_1284924 [Mycena vulgaris]|nr:hypothetical protein DFH09DRAFT_1284924 [Mycena vulgaris]